ncbi:hypothetical protein Goklo_026740, partial [Gossypium klotzschianum]|nr:hypothetical protein [Gossypium klotzschianum]
STHLRSTNLPEFLYSILFLLLVVGYLVRTHLLFVSRAYIALEQLRDSLDEIRGSAFGCNMLWGVHLAYGVKSIRSRKKYLNINLNDIIDVISIIPNPINQIIFLEI